MDHQSQRRGMFCIGEHQVTDIWSPSNAWTHMKLHIWAFHCLIPTFNIQKPFHLMLKSNVLLKFWGSFSMDQADLHHTVGIIKQQGDMTVLKWNVIQSSELQKIFFFFLRHMHSHKATISLGTISSNKLKMEEYSIWRTCWKWWTCSTPSVFFLRETLACWEFSRVRSNCCFVSHALFISRATSMEAHKFYNVSVGKHRGKHGIFQVFNIV